MPGWVIAKKQRIHSAVDDTENTAEEFLTALRIPVLKHIRWAPDREQTTSQTATTQEHRDKSERSPTLDLMESLNEADPEQETDIILTRIATKHHADNTDGTKNADTERMTADIAFAELLRRLDQDNPRSTNIITKTKRYDRETIERLAEELRAFPVTIWPRAPHKKLCTATWWMRSCVEMLPLTKTKFEGMLRVHTPATWTGQKTGRNNIEADTRNDQVDTATFMMFLALISET